MGCLGCLGGVGKLGKEEQPLIIDVEQTIADAAWDMFVSTHGRCKRKFLRRKNYRIDVPMNFYHFEQAGDAKFKPKKRPAGDVDAGAEATPSQSLLKGKQLAHRDQTSPEHIGLETIFNNDTDKDQTYNFSFQKTRTATLNVTYQKGYSIGGKANFNVNLAGLESNINVQVTNTKGETFQESLATSANSEISVGANSCYVVNVVMEEKNVLADFSMDMVMTMPAKRAPVYIKDKKSGDLVFVFTVNNLLDLFDEFEDVTRIKDSDGKVRPDAVEFHIQGIVDGMQLSSHYINLFHHGKDAGARAGARAGAGAGAGAGERNAERDGGEKSPTH